MKLFSKFTLYELILLICSPIIILSLGIYFKNDFLTIITSLVGIISAFFLARGSIFGQMFSIGNACLYSTLSYRNAYYGETITYLFMLLPIRIWGLIAWKKNQSEKTDAVKVNSIKLKEWVLFFTSLVILFIGFYFLLKVLNTSQIIVSTLSVVVNIASAYLLSRRSKYAFLSYIIIDVLLILLWGIPIIQGNLLVIAMLANPLINLINDAYGLISWSKHEKVQ